MGLHANYDKDVVAWANEQAALLRSGRFSELDVEHIADEVEDVGKSEQRALASRMSSLLAHLLKWQFQPERRGNSWKRTIKEQRRGIVSRLEGTPSLQAKITDFKWWGDVWSDAVSQAIQETGIDELPETCIWSIEQVMDSEFLPG